MTITADTLTTYDVEQGTDAWLDLRRGMLTASTISGLLTPTLKIADNDKSRDLIARIVAERVLGWSEPSFTSLDMQRGHDVEPFARDWYAEHHAPVVELGYMVRTLPTGERIGYSPDGLVGDDGLIEIKAPRSKGHLQTHLSGQMPSQHMPQVQTGLFVSARQWCDYISFYGGMPPFVRRIKRDDEWMAAIERVAVAFEQRAGEVRNEYESRTAGLASTDRLTFDLEMVI